MEATGPNAAQISYWNEVSGPKWVSLGDVIHDQIAPLGHEAMNTAAVRGGEAVIDIGCGCGHTSHELAERVGSSGQVLGVDISEPMLDSARERTIGAELGTLAFLNADAQVHAFEQGAHDLVFSRFGVMFFADPVAAFANIRTALRPGGRLTFICWQSISKNPWMMLPLQAVAQYIEMPLPTDPHAPGPFAFADVDRVLGILETAGFAKVRSSSLERALRVGGGSTDLDASVNFVMQMGPAGAGLRAASEEIRSAAHASVKEALAPHMTEDGLRMDSASWIVSAEQSS